VRLKPLIHLSGARILPHATHCLDFGGSRPECRPEATRYQLNGFTR